MARKQILMVYDAETAPLMERMILGFSGPDKDSGFWTRRFHSAPNIFRYLAPIMTLARSSLRAQVAKVMGFIVNVSLAEAVKAVADLGSVRAPRTGWG